MKLHQILKGLIGDKDAETMVRSYDRVGDILITTIPEELKDKEAQIGEALLRLHPHAHVVAKRVGTHNGEFRTRPLQIIAGEERTETLHKENNIRLHLNPEKVYYSVRMAGERLRIARQVLPGEEVAVLGSGIGPFPLVIARHSSAQHVIGIEKNPVAHGYAQRNLQANRRITNVRFYQGDATRVLPQLNRLFRRVITALPTRHGILLDCSIQALARGGTLHHYAMVDAGDITPVIERIETTCAANSRRVVDISTHCCGHCGPKTDRFCFTVQVF